MNFPGRADGNWSWRFRPGQPSTALEERLRDMTIILGRDPQTYLDKDEESGGQPHQTLAADEDATDDGEATQRR